MGQESDQSLGADPVCGGGQERTWTGRERQAQGDREHPGVAGSLAQSGGKVPSGDWRREPSTQGESAEPQGTRAARRPMGAERRGGWRADGEGAACRAWTGGKSALQLDRRLW